MRPTRKLLIWIAVLLATAAKLRSLARRRRRDTGQMTHDIAQGLSDLDGRWAQAQAVANDILTLRGLSRSGAKTRSDTMFTALRAELDVLHSRLADLEGGGKSRKLAFLRRRGARLARLQADVRTMVARFDTLEQQQRDAMEKARMKRERLLKFRGNEDLTDMQTPEDEV
jgi:hypothetical protein